MSPDLSPPGPSPTLQGPQILSEASGIFSPPCSDVDPQLPETASLPRRVLTGAQLATGNCCFPTIPPPLLSICSRPRLSDHLSRPVISRDPAPLGHALVFGVPSPQRLAQFGFSAPGFAFQPRRCYCCRGWTPERKVWWSDLHVRPRSREAATFVLS